MAVATITLTSDTGDSVVVSAPGEDWLDDDIVLDTSPEGMYDTAFTVRTQSGAFEPGGRVTGEQILIRTMTLPFYLTKASKPRFQKLWGTPGNFRKVRWRYDGESGPRELTIRLSKEIVYTTEDGMDADIDGDVFAVVVAIAPDPNYEGPEDVAAWVNPVDQFDVAVVARGGTWPLTFGGSTATVAWNASAATVRGALENLPGVGAGKVTVTGTPATYTNTTTSTPGSYRIVFAAGTNGVLTGSAANLQGVGLLGATKSVTVGYAPATGWFALWNLTDQNLWPEWELDPAEQWWFPDFAFDGAERKWNRPAGSDAARMIRTARVASLLSVMSDPFQDTYVSADLSNFAGLMNGVEPVYPLPPYTGSEEDPVVMPVVCYGPAGARATLRQRRFWSAESGLEA